jgi:exodeoxyribonuclease VII large subunit
VAAVACSTPTHAAQEAVPIDIAEARRATIAHAKRLHSNARRAVLTRARELAQLSRAPSEQIARHRRRLHQLLRELRATARRATAVGRERADRHALVLSRSAERARTFETARRRTEIERLALALAAHDPQRTLERGYALVESHEGEPLTTAEGARAARALKVRFHDGAVPAEVSDA